MEAGDCVVSSTVRKGTFFEDDVSTSLIHRPQIGRLRRLMLAFEGKYVLRGLGRLVAYRLDIEAGLVPRLSLGVTMEDVYRGACSAGLIAVVGDREVASPTFLVRVKAAPVTRCRKCGIGEYVEDPDAQEPCWVCTARNDQAIFRGDFGPDGGGECRP